MPSRRPVAIALATSAFYAGIFVTNAQAEMHYVRVTLVTGQQITITVDVPPGTPVDQLQIPGLPAPVSAIVDLGSTESTPSPTATAPPVVDVTVTPTPTATRTPAPTPKSRTGSPGTKKGNTVKAKTETKKDQSTSGDANQTSGQANTESLTGRVPTATPAPRSTSPSPSPSPSVPTVVPDDHAQPPAKDNPTF